MSVNKVILVGRLGQNPEVRYTPSGAAVANFSIATSESWADKSGQKQEKTEWHRIVVWGKTAENCNQYLSKGRQVYIEGRLQTRQWQDKDGQTKSTTEIQAQTVQFLGGAAGATGTANSPQDRSSRESGGFESSMGPGSMGSSSSSQSFQASQSSQPPQAFQSNHQGASMEPSFTEDDIPF